ncbi:MAG: hypothetical protein ACK56I_36960 [bacterium]
MPLLRQPRNRPAHADLLIIGMRPDDEDVCHARLYGLCRQNRDEPLSLVTRFMIAWGRHERRCTAEDAEIAE